MRFLSSTSTTSVTILVAALSLTARCGFAEAVIDEQEQEVEVEVECEGDRSKLFVSVITDVAAYEDEWILEKLVSGKEGGGWEEVETIVLDLDYYAYEETLCLDPGTYHRWTLTDNSYESGGAAAVVAPVVEGSYSVTLNGKEIVSNGEEILSNIRFGARVSQTFLTEQGGDDGDAPSESPGTDSCRNAEEDWLGDDGIRRSCNDIAGLRVNRNKRCSEIDEGYEENCPGLCLDRCSCHDYERSFRLERGSDEFVTCAAVSEERLCATSRTVEKNCPTLCNNDECAAR
mmetsp:Transcript_22261/g.52903  ORF Transcript_22261/g.52903 Transcript_22261/m.52903 type:complete len:288 (+) Transcript_22261:238-1101(+)|eukprot:CAMPEP_0197176722 /NCGR_PEP_ID=MMETSP1423-20130617/2549_1 /TAXON_ID=476441 /ORGANISM="Pseudo-nitzschia heimii, Strain UNC1101" /LENGTH=287 /DNA_ID=CAMNT_0042626131 /DNA_START=234 /DNA_END=1097 /DNA_ORIENTATION=-